MRRLIIAMLVIGGCMAVWDCSWMSMYNFDGVECHSGVMLDFVIGEVRL